MSARSKYSLLGLVVALAMALIIILIHPFTVTLQLRRSWDVITAKIVWQPPGLNYGITPTTAATYANGTISFQAVPATASSLSLSPPYQYYAYFDVAGGSCGTTCVGWEVCSSVACVTGCGLAHNETIALGGQTDALTITVTSCPQGYVCGVYPPATVTVTSGGTATFSIWCSPKAYPQAEVGVVGDTCGAEWVVRSSVASVSGDTDETTVISLGGQTDTLTASIIAIPQGYTVTISPTRATARANGFYEFTVTCSTTPVFTTTDLAIMLGGIAVGVVVGIVIALALRPRRE